LEPSGLGVIKHATDALLHINALSVPVILQEAFATLGVKARESDSGRVASRLIRQLGGPQGCRVLKISGVRDLIAKFGPARPFTRHAALSIIHRGTEPDSSRIEEYADLYIERRPGGSLTSEMVLSFLIKQEVFRAGVEFSCPYCLLKFWKSLDDLASHVRCEMCGETLNAAEIGTSKGWSYRMSGLFALRDQQGAIPVSVVLQQLDTNILSFKRLFWTSMELSPAGRDIDKCETDFVVIEEHVSDLSMVIGEAKSRHGKIDAKDTENLGKVLAAINASGVRGYVVFAKLGQFADDEVDLCRAMNSAFPGRIILLGARELEPYWTYERAKRDFVLPQSAISFDDLASGTRDVYFVPKRKPPSPGAS
jgi:hypothetical protein